jgi:hypothetical protein
MQPSGKQDSSIEAVFSMRSVRSLYNESLYLGLDQIRTRVEAGSNISTVTLRVVGGDEKGVSDLRQ